MVFITKYLCFMFKRQKLSYNSNDNTYETSNETPKLQQTFIKTCSKTQKANGKTSAIPNWSFFSITCVSTVGDRKSLSKICILNLSTSINFSVNV